MHSPSIKFHRTFSSNMQGGLVLLISFFSEEPCTYIIKYPHKIGTTSCSNNMVSSNLGWIDTFGYDNFVSCSRVVNIVNIRGWWWWRFTWQMKQDPKQKRSEFYLYPSHHHYNLKVSNTPERHSKKSSTPEKEKQSAHVMKGRLFLFVYFPIFLIIH
jgi:hypothetical protein